MGRKKNEEKKSTDPINVYYKSSYIPLGEALYGVTLFPDNITTIKYSELKDIAYISNDTFYVLRGPLPKDDNSYLEPGIYENSNGFPEIREPITDDEKEKYSVSKNIIDTSKENIIEVLKNNDKIFVTVTEGGNIFKPEIKKTDDILKRAIKKVLNEKNLDIDLYKNRFSDKNAFLNFKQVIKSDSRLSILLFERGCDVLNMKYTLIIEEKSEDDNVGNRLSEPIVVSSEDEYVI